MTDLSTRDRLVQRNMTQVRHQDEVVRFLPQSVQFSSNTGAPFSSKDPMAWAPPIVHVNLDADMQKIPQDPGSHCNTNSHPENTQDATHLLLTAASALTSLTRQSSPVVERRETISPAEMSFGRQNIYSEMTDTVTTKKAGSREKAIKFPVKLMNILCCEEYQDIISWMPEGHAFIVKKPKAFVSHILPTHFKEVKFSSFTRKLHRWGFTKMLRGKECGAYHHKDFQRGRMDLCMRMRCCDRHGTKSAPKDDASLSSTNTMNGTKEMQQEYPVQEARQDSCDYIHVQYDYNTHAYSNTVILPMPRLPEHTEHFLGAYRPPMTYYDWNTWRAAIHEAGPAKSYCWYPLPPQSHRAKHESTKDFMHESQKL